MTDVHTKEVRSYNMSRIQAKNTKPELFIRKYLHREGFRYRLHAKNLPGKPDIVLKKYKTVIFIHGCFWHGHTDCRYFKLPKTRKDFWKNKIYGNIERDKAVIEHLKSEGWNVIVVWECEIKGKEKKLRVENIISELRNFASIKD